jgi:hypothetical protein
LLLPLLLLPLLLPPLPLLLLFKNTETCDISASPFVFNRMLVWVQLRHGTSGSIGRVQLVTPSVDVATVSMRPRIWLAASSGWLM